MEGGMDGQKEKRREGWKEGGYSIPSGEGGTQAAGEEVTMEMLKGAPAKRKEEQGHKRLTAPPEDVGTACSRPRGEGSGAGKGSAPGLCHPP